MMEEIKTFAMGFFAKAPGSHDWQHVLRVRNLCLHIAETEGADRQVLEIAAYLHDIGRPAQEASRGRICHGERGAKIAGEFLERYPLDRETRNNILHCIRTHRFRGNHAPKTLEAKILFDADKLDAIGAVGVARAFLFAGEVGATLHNPYLDPEEAEAYSEEDTGYREYKLKLAKIKERMLTREGKRLAQERHAFMEAFFERFLEEVEGRV
ncbi:MAG: HD domain-containing protein [Deltaproteobacteria bacterium]|nr:HD domain-containing protein [Deltaproteobacteria bacterium]MBW2017327.1 HD domain-containing protein [Deltaproteobacteria bacterium]MBW2130619.1 HD domain-containing protein [Deltaproteobacteria bacterium]MBW2304637.1 HD domain-containing protein [Deltaproteobacteria bacterium]